MEDITFDASLVDDDLLDRIDFYGTKTDSQEYLPPAPAPPGGCLARQIAAAAEHDDLETVQRLYEELRVLPGASYWTEDPTGLSSALYSAVLHRSRSVTSFLLERSVRPTMTHAREAINQRDTELLETFLMHGWGINDRFHSEATSLLKGVLRDPYLRTWFLDHGADPNIPGERDETALSEVVRYGPFDMIKQFFDNHGASATIGFPLHRAVWREREDQLEIIAFFLHKGADVNQILHQDTIWYFREMLCGLCTPLYEAAERGKLDVARLLIEHGADPLIQDSRRCAALQLAEKAGHANMVGFLAEVTAMASPPAYQYNRGERGADWGAI